MKKFAIFVLLLILAFSLPAKPNVIFILTDDLGYGDVGGPLIRTPRLNGLAAEGTILTDHYCAAPVCAPSRASLLTGKRQGHCSVKNNEFDKPIAERVTIGTVMKSAGYHTYAVGKWGCAGGGESKQPISAHPLDRGFDHFYGFRDHLAGHTYFHYDGYRNGVWMGIDEDRTNATKSAEGRYSTELFTDKAIGYIDDCRKQHPGEPFFVYLAYTTVHGPFEIPGEVYKEYRSLPPIMGRYATCITILDEQIGRLVDHLKQTGALDDTVIIFTSDNGPAKEYGADPDFFHSAGPFRGIKRDVYEGGMRVPTFIWKRGANWPKRDTSPSISVDWLPTLAELAGSSAPAGLDGVSLLPRWTGNGESKPSTIATRYWFNRQQEMERVGDISRVRIGGDSAPWQEYDLKRDPHQDHPL